MSPDTRQRRMTITIVGAVVALAITATTWAPGVPGSSNLSAGVAGAVDTAAPALDAAHAALGTTSRYAPISPIRVLDTRSDVFRRRLPANGTLSILPIDPAVVAASGVQTDGAAAVVLNITMVDPAGATFATVWPTGTPQPTVSSLNADTPMQTVANLVTVPVGADGHISLYSSGAADYIVDVQGVYADATTSTSGRFVPIQQRRAVDTRTGGTLGAATARSIDLTAVGVPATASAAILNVTATNTAATGFLTVWPTGTPMPLASNLNVPGPGATVANQVIARVSNGAVSVYTETGTDLIVDVSGYMTGSVDPSGVSGLYVALAPARLLDTRSAGPFSNGLPIGSGATIALPIADRGGVPNAGVLAVAVNVTATRTLGYGYVTGWPANTPIPSTSTLNFVSAGRTVANHAITALNGGAVNFYSFGGADLLVDLMGFWTDGSPVAPPAQPGALTINTVSAPATTAAPPAPPSFGPHSFLYDRPGGYGRWDPCRPIVYLVNADRADHAMVDQLNLAIGEIEKATGLDFVYGGPTSEGLDYSTPAGVDAVLGFSDATATPDLVGSVIGVGGGMFSPSTGRVRTGFAFADVQGIVSMDKLRATFMHEIAHMVGLDHVGDSGQLMYFLATSISTFQNGDREGLWRVGAAQGCLAGDQGAAADQTPSGPSDPLRDTPDDAVLVVRT